MTAGRRAMPRRKSRGRESRARFPPNLSASIPLSRKSICATILAVRDRAVRLIAEEDAYAALLISMHTYSLLSEHADRSTIAPNELPLLDQFLEQQKAFQKELQRQILSNQVITEEQKSENAILDHFRLLQATDNLSLLTCVNFSAPADLLHPLPLRDGGHSRVDVQSAGERHFVLDPYPFDQPSLRLHISRAPCERKIVFVRGGTPKTVRGRSCRKIVGNGE